MIVIKLSVKIINLFDKIIKLFDKLINLTGKPCITNFLANCDIYGVNYKYSQCRHIVSPRTKRFKSNYGVVKSFWNIVYLNATARHETDY